MQQITKDGQTIDVQALKSVLLQRKITKDHFRLPYTKEQAYDLMRAAYMAEVEFRHREYKEDEHVVANLRSVASYLTDEGSRFGIMLCGVCGNGKTTMLYAFQNMLNYLIDRNIFDKEKVGIRIIDAKEILSLGKDDKEFSRIRADKMIGIEDLGKEQTGVMDYGNLINPVIDLLEYRYNQQLFTFITTNLTPKDIRKKYGNRIADRFNEMLHVVIFGGKTYRS